MVIKYADPTKDRVYDKVVDFFHNYEHDPEGLNHCIGSDANPYHIHHVRIAGRSGVQHVIDLAHARGHGRHNEEQWFFFSIPLRGGHWLEKGVKIPPPPPDKWNMQLFHGSKRKPNVTIHHFERKPGGGKQRLGSGDWEQATNRQQRRLTRVFDKWSAKTRRALTDAANRGVSVADQTRILDGAMPELEAQIVATLEIGTEAAARISAGERAKLPAVQSVIEQHSREDRLLVATALIPVIYARLLPEVLRGLARDSAALQMAFVGVRAAPGQYAGRAWVMIFDTQEALGKMRESERRAEGKTVEPVRWDLDPRAEHCAPSPGHHACPELAGVYEGGWSTLKTVPAGLVTCRGNCRCTLWVFRDGQWRRGVYDD